MPKIGGGRLDGVWGMESFTSEELYKWADQHEALIKDPLNTDDPKWLQRRAEKLRRLAIRKEKSLETKLRQGKRSNRKDKSTNQVVVGSSQ
jgi:hypothetical protein